MKNFIKRIVSGHKVAELREKLARKDAYINELVATLEKYKDFYDKVSKLPKDSRFSERFS